MQRNSSQPQTISDDRLSLLSQHRILPYYQDCCSLKHRSDQHHQAKRKERTLSQNNNLSSTHNKYAELSIKMSKNIFE